MRKGRKKKKLQKRKGERDDPIRLKRDDGVVFVR